MVISHKHRFIFFCNGKTGTTSIQSALEHLDESQNMNHGAACLWANKHMPPAVAQAMLPSSIWNSYFKFVFVRNPYDWVVSHYEYSFRPKGRRQLVADFLRQPLSIESGVKQWRHRRNWRQKRIIFEEDVDTLWNYLKSVRGLAGSESLLQENYTHNLDGQQLVDLVGRFENLQGDVQRIGEKIGFHIKIDHLNKTRSTRKGRLRLSDDAAKKVRNIWTRDFERFDY